MDLDCLWACREETETEEGKKRILPLCYPISLTGFPGGARGKQLACQCRRHRRQRFDPGIRKIPWRMKWQPTPVFLPGKFHGERRAWWATVHRVAKRHDWACTHNSLLVQVFEDSLINLHPCFSKCGPQVQNIIIIIIIWELLKRQVRGSSLPHIPVESETQHFINPPGDSDAC